MTKWDLSQEQKYLKCLVSENQLMYYTVLTESRTKTT